MPTTVLQQTGTEIVLADTTDHSPAAANDLGTRTAQIDLTGIVAGAYRQSAKVDFALDRAAQWRCRAAIEWSVAPTAGGIVNFFLSASHSATIATGNDGGTSGADAAYVGYGAAAADADEAAPQLLHLGQLVATNDATTQIANIGTFVPPERYGSIIVKNATDQSFNADAVEMSIRLAPIEDEIQD